MVCWYDWQGNRLAVHRLWVRVLSGHHCVLALNKLVFDRYNYCISGVYMALQGAAQTSKAVQWLPFPVKHVVDVCWHEPAVINGRRVDLPVSLSSAAGLPPPPLRPLHHSQMTWQLLLHIAFVEVSCTSVFTCNHYIVTTLYMAYSSWAMTQSQVCWSQ